MHSISEYDEDEPIEKRFEDLCQILCIEGNFREEAWDKYKDIWANFSIDGDQLQWLVCSLYESCRRSSTDSVTGHVVDSAYVSLTRLLSAAKMSLVQFFHRIRKWADMTEMQEEMRYRIERLERQFSVSSVIFKSFATSFYKLFRYESPQDVESISDRITSHDLFKFVWLLFVKARANFPAVTDDIVNSYYLLCCSFEWTLGALLMGGMTALINLDFHGLPKDLVASAISGKMWRPSFDSPPCMLRHICEDNDVQYVECKTVKEHFFRPYIVRLIEKDLLKTRSQQAYNNFFSIESFNDTFQTLSNRYEEYVIGTGDFDERILLSPNAAEDIGSAVENADNSFVTPSNYHLFNNMKIDAVEEQIKKNSTNIFEAMTRHNGGINFLCKNEARKLNLVQLQSMLISRTEHPSEALAELIETHCPTAPLNEIQDRVDSLTKEFVMAYDSSCEIDENQKFHLSMQTKQRVQLSHSLYYLALENIALYEISLFDCSSADHQAQNICRLGKPELSILFNQDMFHRALFASCIEIVLLCCDKDKQFPWVCNALDVDALHIYKVVEPLMRNLDFPREIVRYFSQIVEHILDSYAWREASPIWPVINMTGRAPSIEEVMPVERLEYMNGMSGGLEHRRLPPRVGQGKSATVSLMQNQQVSSASSLRGSSVQGQHSRQQINSSVGSPLKKIRLEVQTGGNPRRSGLSANADDESARAAAQLLATGDPAEEHPIATPSIEPGGGDEDSSAAAAASIQDVQNTRDVNLEQQVNQPRDPRGMEMGSDVEVDAGMNWSSGCQMENSSVVRHDSMALFFRHFYSLACGRLRDLLDKLSITSNDVMLRVWTLFERCVQHETDLLKDRCLDQILLCCLYAINKVLLHRPLSFVNIVQAYRMQPQSRRDVYRNVLIDKVQCVLPGKMGEEPQQYEEEKRADLSRFYNLVYLTRMSDCIKQHLINITSSGSNNNMLLDDGSGNVQGGGAGFRSGFYLSPLISPHPSISHGSGSLHMSNASRTLPNKSHHSNLIPSHGMETSSSNAAARRLANNRNIFIAQPKGGANSSNMMNISSKRIVFTVGQGTGKDLNELNAMVNSADRRASIANLAMGLKRPATQSQQHASQIAVSSTQQGGGASSAYHVSTPHSSSSRSLTLINPQQSRVPVQYGNKMDETW